MGRASALSTLLFALVACGESNPAANDAGPDTAIDAPPDADLVHFQFKGQFVDWDSTTAAPCPIVGATWTARYDTSRVATTDANGMFTIALASYTPLLDIVPPSAASLCTNPQSTYEIPGIAIAPPAVFYAGGEFVARALTASRVTTFYASIGSAFDATRAGLLVHVDGPSHVVSISSAHAATQAFDGSAWAAGTTGRDVFFPNIEVPMTQMTTVTVDGGAIGTGSVPIAAGAITYMAVITN